MKKQVLFLCLVYFWVLLSWQATCQTLLKGKVVDAQTQTGLPGALILTLPGQGGTIAQTNGQFSFLADTMARTLQITCLGYETQLVPLANQYTKEFIIALSPDEKLLNEVQVVGFDNTKKLQENAGAVQLITSRDLDRGNSFTLQPVLNTIPGVRMDQSNLSNASLTIRGVGVRSNFGIRSLKMYLNDIPLTETDGFTRLEAIDVSILGRAEIIKGPASSIYGVGLGGVLNFQVRKAPYRENSFENQTLVGSFGLWRNATQFHYANDKVNITLNYGYQHTDGYRNWNKDTRNFFTGVIQYAPSSKQQFTFLLSRTSQFAQVPGALNEIEVSENPQQANNLNLLQKTRRNQIWTRMGLSHTYEIRPWLSNTSTAFVFFYDQDNPLLAAYLRNLYQSYGGRTKFVIEPTMRFLKTKWIVGAEFIQSLQRSSRFQNIFGTEGNLLAQADFNNQVYTLFYQSETVLAPKLVLTLGLSYNKVVYNLRNYTNTAQTGKKDFVPQWMPRVAFSYLWKPALNFHFSISQGFSPPATGEITASDGTINLLVEPETGTNYELNIKGGVQLNKASLQYECNVFHFPITNELIPQTSAQNITFFNNSGSTTRNGIELAINYLQNFSENHFLRSVRLFSNLSYTEAKFNNYRVLDAQNELLTDNSGRWLTGIMPWIITAGLDLFARKGFYTNLTFFYFDRMPVVDDNSAFNDGYPLLNWKVGYFWRWSSRWASHLQLGVDNVMNEAYSSQMAFNVRSINGQPPAYFNPSMPVNVYGSFSLRLYFGEK